eukprot:1604435-Prymnesium_polylepis.1
MQPAESQPAASSSQGAAATASRPVSHGVVAAPGPSLRVGSGLHHLVRILRPDLSQIRNAVGRACVQAVVLCESQSGVGRRER